MFTILPFEQKFYKKFDVEVEFVGHPLIDAIDNFKRNSALSSTEFDLKYKLNKNLPKIAILPGSRVQEIKLKLPIMLKALEEFNDFEILLAAAPTIEMELYLTYLDKYQKVKIINNDTYNLLNQADLAIVIQVLP